MTERRESGPGGEPALRAVFESAIHGTARGAALRKTLR